MNYLDVKRGTQVEIKALAGEHSSYISAISETDSSKRRAGAVGAVLCPVTETGMTIWWVKHDHDGESVPYAAEEFEPV